jgi:hypothetical protein
MGAVMVRCPQTGRDIPETILISLGYLAGAIVSQDPTHVGKRAAS